MRGIRCSFGNLAKYLTDVFLSNQKSSCHKAADTTGFVHLFAVANHMARAYGAIVQW